MLEHSWHIHCEKNCRWQLYLIPIFVLLKMSDILTFPRLVICLARWWRYLNPSVPSGASLLSSKLRIFVGTCIYVSPPIQAGFPNPLLLHMQSLFKKTSHSPFLAWISPRNTLFLLLNCSHSSEEVSKLSYWLQDLINARLLSLHMAVLQFLLLYIKFRL